MSRIASRAAVFAIAAILATPVIASAQTSTGNRANGLNYQPTPAQVAPRERAAGVLPPAAKEQAANRDLEQIDRDLLRSHGLSTSNVPKLNEGQ